MQPSITAAESSSPRVPQPNRLQKPRAKSRTMQLAMGMVADASATSASTAASRATITTRWRASSNTGGLKSPAISTSASATSASFQSKGSMTLSKSSNTYATIYDYFRRPAQRILHPVTTIEQYWAIRATIAETRLHAHEVHKQELAAMSASHAENRSRELAELNSRYERELSRIKYMVWTILAVLVILLSLFVFLVVRYVPASTSSVKGSTHFTIPILSPFASVIEHETSAVNVPLVAILLLSAGVSLFVWLRCCGSRR
ncbi:hypothetical protein L226DRAFT_484771 [Lentinus tigrinus ALCF2SS1-7]|uniref:Uncharacterized protein n=1 Tax=Lentinus tigrinus ALCF2SS1-6 TaxID=1328759 RepID=A0A5C2SBP3_9APHY|nr:hypothetical protein L227DRAFT_653262 [Lentinus tigrinus ALCF2SS1-6]RPD75816.1 hypothetical protein L226DRAFT_484771 [Lentinus tigrinus ALCF2SS1-7]